MSDALLSIRGLHVTYGSVRAVRDVSLDVGEGEVVALLGLNGAGKSSTLWSILGATPITGGSIEFEGQEVVGLTTDRIAGLGIAVVPEGRRVFPNLTVEDNIRLGGATVKDDPVSREELSELFPIVGKFWTRVAGSLSGGQQQQVAIARALAMRPKLLILDEPSLGLAPVLVDEVFDLIEALRDRGMTQLLVEQNAEQALDIADRAYILRTGEIVASGSAADLRSSGEMEIALLGEVN